MAENKEKSGEKAVLHNVLQRIKNQRVLVVGDIMLDRFVYGTVERISPESPVPVLSIGREERMLGGAGNALANLAGLGAQARIVSVVGDDAEGRLVRDKVKTLGFDDDLLITDSVWPTIVKTRFLAGHQQLLRTDQESKQAISSDAHEKVLRAVLKALDGVGAVLLSDYGKGVLTQNILNTVIKEAQDKDIPIIVDPKGADFSIYKGATVVTPNKKELSEAARGMAVSNDESIIAAAEKIINECGIEAVIATRSKDGMSVIQKGQSPAHIRSVGDIEVFDVSGAGDAVIATIAAGMAAGAELLQAAELANLAGSIVVTKVGTAPVRFEELQIALDDSSRSSLSRTRQAPLQGWDEASEDVKRWRARGLKVGFTNGCFDVLHKGHVSYLNEARQNCDRLIVALNRDESVCILKGPDRPVHDEDARAAVLGALGAVDMVVLFGAEEAGKDNTAIALLETLKPDVYFKGGDYNLEEIPEASTVQSYGGQVKVMGMHDGHSTTSSISKIKGAA